MRPVYINREVAEITGMKQQDVSRFSHYGMIIPTVSEGKGKGTNRIYSSSDVLKFILLPVFKEYGMSMAQIKRLFGLLQSDLFSPSNPLLYHGLPNKRAFVGVYDITKDDFTAAMSFEDDPETCDPNYRESFEENLRTFTVDMLNHKSCFVIDITDCIRKLPVVEE